MKKYFISFIILSMLFLHANTIEAQINLEFTVDSTFYGYLFYPTKISDTETKYVFLDTVADNFSLYNLDLSPFKLNIQVPYSLQNPDGNSAWFYHVMYITRSLFDCDTSNIEYLYSAQNYPGVPIWVMREDGTVLFTADSSRAPYCLGCPGGTNLLRPILETENGAKLVIMRDYQTSTGAKNISIYSLCGSLPNGIDENGSLQENSSQQYVMLYPNPGLNQVTFDITLPDNLNDYSLNVIDSNSRLVGRTKVDKINSHFSIDTSSLTNGTYFFTLSSIKFHLQSGEFIISK